MKRKSISSVTACPIEYMSSLDYLDSFIPNTPASETARTAGYEKISYLYPKDSGYPLVVLVVPQLTDLYQKRKVHG